MIFFSHGGALCVLIVTYLTPSTHLRVNLEHSKPRITSLLLVPDQTPNILLIFGHFHDTFRLTFNIWMRKVTVEASYFFWMAFLPSDAHES